MKGKRGKMPAKQWTHGDLIEDLVEHLEGEQSVVFHECAMGSRWFRSELAVPDAVCMNKSYTKTDIRIYEVKVSNSDLSGDLRRGKWEKYREFADRVFFAVPSYLDYKEPLKNHPVGIMVRGETGWRMARPAPLNPGRKPWDEEVWLSLLFSHVPQVQREQKRINELEDEKAAMLSKDLDNIRRKCKGWLSDMARRADDKLNEAERAKRHAYKDALDRIARFMGVKDDVIYGTPDEYGDAAEQFFEKVTGDIVRELMAGWKRAVAQAALDGKTPGKGKRS